MISQPMSYDPRLRCREWFGANLNCGKTLVVGSKVYKNNSDRRLLFPDAIGLDMEEGEGVDIVADLEVGIPGQYDHIDCHSVLEHVKRPWIAAKNIEAALVPGGTLFVAVPFVWRRHGYPSDYWRMTVEALGVLFENIEWKSAGYLDCRDQLFTTPPLPPEGKQHRHQIPRCETVAFGVKIG